MEIEKLIKHMREEAQDYRSGRTLGRAFADAEDVLDEAATALEQLQAENIRLKEEIQQMRWIPVEERLPDKPGHYLVCTSINYWHGGCMDVNQEHKYHDSGTPVGYDGTTMSVLDCYYDITGDWNRVCNKHVTHWMPLPAAPKEETYEK